MAAAIAIDAFYAIVQTHVKLPATLLASWRKQRTARHSQVTEVIRRAFRLKEKGTATLKQNLKEIYRLRDMAVHPSGNIEAPHLHPEMDVGVEWRFAVFRAHNAALLVNAATWILWDLAHKGKPADTRTMRYMAALRGRLAVLFPSGHPMATPASQIRNPTCDPSLHLPFVALESGLRALPALPTDTGRLILIVRRPADGSRETPERVRLKPEDGVPGDSWGRDPKRMLDAQIAVMQRDVAELIANGQPLTLFGDSLFVELDLSTANLPIGSRLRVGEAVVEVTPMPHDGCSKFKKRFGVDALFFVNAKPTRHLNLRGIYWKVIEAGEACVGSPVEVIARP